MCSSRNPGKIPIRLKSQDGVREDSFMIEIRRKSTWMLTEFFQGNSFGGDDEIYRDFDYYDQFC